MLQLHYFRRSEISTPQLSPTASAGALMLQRFGAMTHKCHRVVDLLSGGRLGPFGVGTISGITEFRCYNSFVP